MFSFTDPQEGKYVTPAEVFETYEVCAAALSTDRCSAREHPYALGKCHVLPWRHQFGA
jgi:hypothetical protein